MAFYIGAVIIGVALIVFLMILCDTEIFKYELARKKYVSYLKENNDTEALKKIGEINPWNQNERWRIPYIVTHSYLTEKSKTSEEAKEYLSACNKYIFSYAMYLIGIYAAFFGYFVGIENVADNLYVKIGLQFLGVIVIFGMLFYLTEKNRKKAQKL